ncbi:MAG: hypothetical protein JNM93_00920 [Bacteriovoracaceae bacterium]|nr:hypothetical protein [Bacteriovoracaceae bacterium]
MKAFITILVLISTAYAETTPEVLHAECSSAKEFITTLEYLRSRNEFQLDSSQALKVSEKVATACTGAAQKFVDVVNLLTKLTVDSKSAVETAVMLSAQERGVVDNYLTIFKYAFVEDGLDLDLMNSLSMAKSLSVEFKGEQKKARDDFLELVKFCTHMKTLNLPLGSCAQTAAKVTRMGEKFKNSVASPFKDLFHFLTEAEAGPKLSKLEGLKFAEEMMGFGPMAEDNFVQAYKYAISKDGLGFSQVHALAFAKNLAKYSFKIEKKP